MLVLSRSRGQRIIVDGNIVLTVASLAGNRVRIGIEATPEIGVARYELAAQFDLLNPGAVDDQLPQ